MKQASLLRRIGTYLLGLVDEYWAMRRPWQYGTKQPNAGCSAMAITANPSTESALRTMRVYTGCRSSLSPQQ